MGHSTCKRIWEGTLGIAITPRKKRDGNYFWSFSFVRAFRRSRDADWEYVQHFGQEHGQALGVLMSKAFQFMQQTDPTQFVAAAMNEATASSQHKPRNSEATLDSVKLPPVKAAA